MIRLTEEAKKKIHKLLEEKSDPAYFLRIGVKGGGCSGMTYSVELDNRMQENDKVFEEENSKIVCDPRSLLYLSGLQIDYKDALVGGGFQFSNPNASGSCGCGTSFSV